MTETSHKEDPASRTTVLLAGQVHLQGLLRVSVNKLHAVPFELSK